MAVHIIREVCGGIQLIHFFFLETHRCGVIIMVMHCWWECMLGQAFALGSNLATSCKVENPRALRLKSQPQRNSHTLGDMYETVNCNIICNVKDSNQPKFPFAGEQVNRPCYVHLLEQNTGGKRNELALSISKWMKPKGIWKKQVVEIYVKYGISQV